MTVAPIDIDDSDVTPNALTVVEANAVAAINKSEVEAQLDSAHKYPRSIKRFRQEALSMATISEEVAQSCIYSLPRGGKPITGPSVRLAEICASAWGNIHVGARPVDVGDTEVTSQGVAWDLERNFRVTVESKRRITNKDGKRFNDDMIVMTQNAANSIALRNAIFRIIPRAYVDIIYSQVREVAIGNASTLAENRAKLLDRLAKMGVDQARVLHALGKPGVEDIGLEDIETLIGYRTAIKEGVKTVDELFPAPPPKDPGPTEQGRRISLGKKDGGSAGATAPAAAAPSATASASGPPAETKGEAAAANTPAADGQLTLGAAAASTTPHDPVTGEVTPEPAKDFVMSTAKQRSEVARLAAEARVQISDVCAKYGVASTTELARDKAEDAIQWLKGMAS